MSTEGFLVQRGHPDAVVGGAREPYLLTSSGARVLLVGSGEQAEISVTGLATTLMAHTGVPAEHIRLMLDPPGPTELRRAVAGIAAEATETLLIYCRGPARLGPTGEIHLLDGLVASSALLDTIRSSSARTVVLILDCLLPFPSILSAGAFPAPLPDTEFLLAAGSFDAPGTLGDALITFLRKGDPAAPRELSLRRVVEHLARSAPSTSRLPGPDSRAGTAALARNAVYPVVVRTPRLRPALVALACVVALLVAGAVWWSAPSVPTTDPGRSTALAADARNLQTTDPGLAAQLAIAAYREAPTEQAVDQLYNTLNSPLDAVVTNTHSSVLQVASAPDASLVAASEQNRSAQIWNVADPAAPVLDATIKAGGNGIAFGPHATLLAAGCPTGIDLCLWSLTDPRHPAIIGRLPRDPARPADRAKITAMSISADGTLLALAAEQGFTVLWSIVDPTHPRYLTTLANPGDRGALIASVAIAPRGHLLAQSILGGTLQLWNIADPAAPVQIADESTGYASVAFSPDGSMLGAVGDTSIGLWDLARPSAPTAINITPISPGSNLIDLRSTSFSPDGTHFYFAGTDTEFSAGELCTVDVHPDHLASGSGLGNCTNTNSAIGDIGAVAGGAVFAGDYDGTLRMWRSPLTEIDDVAPTDDFTWSTSQDGHLLVAPIGAPGVSPSTSVGLWDIAGPGQPTLLSTVATGTAQLTALPTATTLLVDTTDDNVQLWNIADPHHPVKTGSLGTASFPDAITDWPDPSAVGTYQGANLITVLDSAGTVHLWQVTTSGAPAQVGTIRPASRVAGPAGITNDGHAVWLITSAGVDWWDVSDPARPVHRGTTPQHAAGSLSSASDLLATAGIASVKGGQTTSTLFDLDGETPSSTAVPGVVGETLDVSADGRLLAATTAPDDSVLLWSIADPRQPRLLATVPTVPGLQEIQIDLADDRMIDRNDDTVDLWRSNGTDTPTHEATIALQMVGFSGHEVLASIGFVGSGGTIALVSDEGTIDLFDADPTELANRLCPYTGVAMTPEQWQRYAPQIPYQLPCR